MALKGTSKVTITLDRTTVKKLREEKGVNAWDAFMLNLIEGVGQGVRIRCIKCRKMFRSGDINSSPSALAKRLGWNEISVKGRLNSIGFVCDKCSSETEAMK